VKGWVVAGVVAATGFAAQSAPASADQLTIVATCSPAPAGCTGWYRQPVAVKWTISPPPPTSIVQSGSCLNEVISVDTTAVTKFCTASWNNTGSTSWVTIKVDRTAPSVSAGIPLRPPDSNGWYNHPIDFPFKGDDATSGVASCQTVTFAGPDSPSSSVLGSCRDVAGNVGTAGLPLRYDATAPDVMSASPTRKPDHDGWFNHPVGLRVRGRDRLSGVVACGPGAITTPEVVASCTDRAGNVGSRGFGFRYDATPPALRVSGEPADARAYVRWRAPGARRIKVVRTPGENGATRSVVFRGRGHGLSDGDLRNGRRYSYAITAVDQAANATTRTVRVVPGARLLAPRPGAELAGPPVLRWTRVRHTRYYNVQLYRVGSRHPVKLLSAWPRRAHLRVDGSWRYGGRRRALIPGLYRWFVWPGIGAPAERRFGTLVGRGSFRVTATAG
jgi:hypothetical protein